MVIEKDPLFRINKSLRDLNYPTISQTKGKKFQIVYEEELANIDLHAEIRRIVDFLVDKKIPTGIIIKRNF